MNNSGPLTTPEAWTVIAEAFERNADRDFQPLEMYEDGLVQLGAAGLCAAVSELYWRNRISEEQYRTMGKTVQRTLYEAVEMRGYYSDWLAGCDREGAAIRCMLATLFALEPNA